MNSHPPSGLGSWDEWGRVVLEGQMRLETDIGRLRAEMQAGFSAATQRMGLMDVAIAVLQTKMVLIGSVSGVLFGAGAALAVSLLRG